MVSSDSIAVFVPVLFLLVVELANITRDTVDLPQLAKREMIPVRIQGQQTMFGHIILPNLGRLLFIHWGSMMLLSMTAFIALVLTSGILQAGLLFATAVLLYLYPVFEIAEYDELMSTGQFPKSYWSHVCYVSVLFILSILAPIVFTSLEILSIGAIGLLYLGMVFTGVPFLAARSFTLRLSDELRPNYDAKQTDERQINWEERQTETEK